ncbi:spore germination cell wall hydrolase CwlJ-like protein [Caulobacter ginsengisoli]|uniref:Spore germination cell wall hydrolase CwlJ-like protein n=1 Tax=Caulobacter ginsengisoli TaxID=400775 RepID=A0ABU0IVN1_9CAUL|nr:cell wall hydrolase [Caulobacter ginsengisoli]MDQ0466069.1 spore germination cell wall hydrolase CwlJ-like protein [Caulobacter ginsengisoli]
MFEPSQTRVSAREPLFSKLSPSRKGGWKALIGAALTGTAVGLIVGGAYLAGGMAQAASQHARIARLADAAQDGFSESSLKTAAGRMDAGILFVAQRHDPYTSAGSAQRDRQAALLAARLERRAEKKPDAGGVLLRASFGGPFNPAAAPFRLSGALEASRDLDCLTAAVYYEARGETPSGQAAVAQVVLNRVRHPAFPKTVCGVVFQGAYSGGACQFSFACDGSMRKRREPAAWARAERVAARALNGYVMTEVGNATNFHTINVSPGWGPRMLRVAQVGLHIFYRFGGPSGSPGAFTGRPTLSIASAADAPVYGAQPTLLVSAQTSGPPEVLMASAVLSAPPPSGVGGPLGRTAEPASAPKLDAEPAPPVDAPIKSAPPSP